MKSVSLTIQQNLSEVYQLCKSAITGDDEKQSRNSPLLFNNKRVHYEQYEAPEETYEEVEEEKKGESITNE